jgi:hypothetical protein
LVQDTLLRSNAAVSQTGGHFPKKIVTNHVKTKLTLRSMQGDGVSQGSGQAEQQQ